MKTSVDGIILAAGFSSRTAAFKMGLQLGEKKMIQHVIDEMKELCSRVVIVAGYKKERIIQLTKGYDNLMVVFNPNYRVSTAEIIYPAADVSEQISTAGYEASGTSNMKFALNGALTVGTLDGANIEIMEEVGPENIFIFGLSAEEVANRRASHRPDEYYQDIPGIKQAIDLIREGFFCPDERNLFQPLMDLLMNEDRYLVLADFEAYHRAQMEIDALYGDPEAWTRKSILNVARIGKFSSDRTIQEYNRDIWQAEALPIEKDRQVQGVVYVTRSTNPVRAAMYRLRTTLSENGKPIEGKGFALWSPEAPDTVFAVMLALNGLLFVGLSLLAPWISAFFQEDAAALEPVLRALALLFLIDTLALPEM